jgi:ABC-type glycerol-3-phosphate transport system permease component
MAITAFKEEADLYRVDHMPFWFHLPPTLKNFRILFFQTDYGAWIVNTATVSAWVVGITPMQEFLYAAVFVSPTEEKLVTVGVPTMLIRGDVYYWGLLMAAALLTDVPVAILYTLFLDRFVHGVTGGARR